MKYSEDAEDGDERASSQHLHQSQLLFEATRLASYNTVRTRLVWPVVEVCVGRSQRRTAGTASGYSAKAA